MHQHPAPKQFRGYEGQSPTPREQLRGGGHKDDLVLSVETVGGRRRRRRGTVGGNMLGRCQKPSLYGGVHPQPTQQV